MKKHRILLCLLAALVMISGTAMAMISANYQLNWFVPLTGSGGAADSARYSVDFTVGQTATGIMTGGGKKIESGFWTGGLGAGPEPGVTKHLYIPIAAN